MRTWHDGSARVKFKGLRYKAYMDKARSAAIHLEAKFGADNNNVHNTITMAVSKP